MKVKSRVIVLAVTLWSLLLIATTPSPLSAAGITEKEAYEIGIEAYHYFYPLIFTDLTRRVQTNMPAGVKPGLGPMNTFIHAPAFPPAEFRTVVRPNFDTLYSTAWLDLTKEPMIISAPDTRGRYYLLEMMDMWTDVFAAPGKRTSGTKAVSFAIVPRGWKGNLPKGITSIESPTPYVWIIGRTQTNGPKDYDAVHKIQEGYKVTPLSQWGKKAKQFKFIADQNVDMKTPPLVQVTTMSAAKYFSYAAELMKLNPPHVTDWSQVARLKRIGIEPGKGFDINKVSLEVKAALERAVIDGFKQMKEKAPTLARVVNGWQMNTDTIGVYGNNYLKRAIIAIVALGANQPEDSIYPINVADADGKPLEGNNKYVMHFNKDELPPVEAFWSITMYDAEGFQVANPINRFAIGDRDDLKYNPDGSLDVYIQNESPGGDKESNWLPSPAQGRLAITMRLYVPKIQVLDGRWNPPAIRKIQ
ncbi:MAG: DUF1254 domain-containing protein [Smithella sp.]|jgi:hypothetical protein